MSKQDRMDDAKELF